MQQAYRLSVAPMIDWTDGPCRRFHRVLSQKTWLYTEMITAPAILHGNLAALLDHDPEDQRVALQIGGSDPEQLAEAVRKVAPWRFREVNLNIGCPSDRVQSGCFGAVLMRDPALVAACLTAMRDAAPPQTEITAKCRIGVDEQIPEDILPRFIETLSRAGITRIIIHARKAWLQGLSPRENREIPPLDHPLVHRIKAEFPQLRIEINGGIASLDAAMAHVTAEGRLDGVMIGRAAYQRPFDILGGADDRLGGQARFASPQEAALAMRPEIAAHLAAGGRMHQVTRHMLGLFHGRPGARNWRRTLSEAGPTGDLSTYDTALAEVGA